MELSYEVAEDGSLTNIRFAGLDGRECVSSVKGALGLLKITNPAVTFTARCKAGLYDNISDAEYDRLRKTIESVSLLWQYGDNPDGGLTEYAMNPLMLLANAIELISRQAVELHQDPM